MLIPALSRRDAAGMSLDSSPAHAVSARAVINIRQAHLATLNMYVSGTEIISIYSRDDNGVPAPRLRGDMLRRDDKGGAHVRERIAPRNGLSPDSETISGFGAKRGRTVRLHHG
jgi:hypothetical protein